jgi:hypothetical protein
MKAGHKADYSLLASTSAGLSVKRDKETSNS